MWMGDSRSQTSKTCLFVVMFKCFEYRIYHKYLDISAPLQTFISEVFTCRVFLNVIRSSFVSQDQNMPMQVV